jgi:hypothetical protein
MAQQDDETEDPDRAAEEEALDSNKHDKGTLQPDGAIDGPDQATAQYVLEKIEITIPTFDNLSHSSIEEGRNKAETRPYE